LQREYVEYVYHVRKPCFIEPKHGYTIMEPSLLIPESLGWSHIIRTGQFHVFSGLPSFSEYSQARQGKKEVRDEDIVVSLRHIYDYNYGHVLMQVLPVLELLDECGVSPDIPILINPALAKASFFQEMVRNSELKNRRWISEETAYVHAKEVIFARTEWPGPDMLDSFLDRIGAPRGISDARKRFFILRNNRTIKNMAEVSPILDAFGFEQVRPEALSFPEQMALFSQTAVVCGVGGAALTNAIFGRGSRLRILELCPADWKDLFFYGVAKTCGFTHRHLVGSAFDGDFWSSFSVDPDEFHRFISDAISEG
jgi:hypothetical protein